MSQWRNRTAPVLRRYLYKDISVLLPKDNQYPEFKHCRSKFKII